MHSHHILFITLGFRIFTLRLCVLHLVCLTCVSQPSPALIGKNQKRTMLPKSVRPNASKWRELTRPLRMMLQSLLNRRLVGCESDFKFLTPTHVLLFQLYPLVSRRDVQTRYRVVRGCCLRQKLALNKCADLVFNGNTGDTLYLVSKSSNQFLQHKEMQTPQSCMLYFDFLRNIGWAIISPGIPVPASSSYTRFSFGSGEWRDGPVA